MKLELFHNWLEKKQNKKRLCLLSVFYTLSYSAMRLELRVLHDVFFTMTPSLKHCLSIDAAEAKDLLELETTDLLCSGPCYCSASFNSSEMLQFSTGQLVLLEVV